MRTTVTLDDDLMHQAQAALEESSRTAVLHEALRALIEREAARRLAHLGGSDPITRLPRRRRAAAPGAPTPTTR